MYVFGKKWKKEIVQSSNNLEKFNSRYNLCSKATNKQKGVTNSVIMIILLDY